MTPKWTMWHWQFVWHFSTHEREWGVTRSAKYLFVPEFWLLKPREKCDKIPDTQMRFTACQWKVRSSAAISSSPSLPPSPSIIPAVIFTFYSNCGPVTGKIAVANSSPLTRYTHPCDQKGPVTLLHTLRWVIRELWVPDGIYKKKDFSQWLLTIQT